tara:strand:+ start:463 stop:672 length:210 start_codon:yes stop_codon:yes gene_type:complete
MSKCKKCGEELAERLIQKEGRLIYSTSFKFKDGTIMYFHKDTEDCYYRKGYKINMAPSPEVEKEYRKLG